MHLQAYTTCFHALPQNTHHLRMPPHILPQLTLKGLPPAYGQPQLPKPFTNPFRPPPLLLLDPLSYQPPVHRGIGRFAAASSLPLQSVICPLGKTVTCLYCALPPPVQHGGAARIAKHVSLLSCMSALAGSPRSLQQRCNIAVGDVSARMARTYGRITLVRAWAGGEQETEVSWTSKLGWQVQRARLWAVQNDR